MDVCDLDFGRVIILRHDIAEVIINEGVEMDGAMVERYHDCLLEHLQAPFSLLINKQNAYSYDFNAQSNLATIPEINTMAVVTYNRVSASTTETLINTPRKRKWNIQMFGDRDNAFSWLKEQQAKMT